MRPWDAVRAVYKARRRDGPTLVCSYGGGGEYSGELNALKGRCKA